MQFIIDTANLEAIKKANEFFPIDGVTTNPSIISKEHTDFVKLIKDIRAIIGPDKMLHVQTTATKAEDMLKEGKLIKETVGGDFYLKVPIGAEGLKATRLLKEAGIKVTMTAIFTPQQALLAAKAGADYVAPYVNRLDNICADGVGVVSDIVDIFAMFDLPCKVLAASFKSVEQVHKVALAGGHAVTINYDLFELLI